jgi:multidrug efflux pump subunit AcrA (membrane-fusion protein)
MRKALIGIAASAVLPVLALGQTPRTSNLVSSPASINAAAPSRNVINLEHCNVKPLVDGEALVPAQEAGVLIDYNVREMQEVKAGEVMAKIDDAMSRKQYENATAEWQAAKTKADTDIEIRVAQEAAKTAEFEYLRNKAANEGSVGAGGVPANKGVAGAVSAVELKHSEYQWRHAVLAIEQYKNEQIVSQFTAAAKKAEMETAQESMNRREVRAPFAGVVQTITPHRGEWVKPGDTVIRLIRMDRLKAEGYLKVADYNPSDVMNRNVTLKVTVAGGRELTFPGKIVYVDPEVQREREYMIRAEIDNRKENNEWLLRPGLPAAMEIQLK